MGAAGASDDPYAILGLAPEASGDEVRRAFRKLARECHPDVAGADPAAAERFKRVRAAYERLSDPVERARLDRSRGRAPRPRGVDPVGRGASGRGGVRGGAGAVDLDLDDLVDGFSVDDFGFGDRPQPRRAETPPPRDVEAPVDLDVATAILGGPLPVDTPTGRVLVTIPAGTSSGTKLRLRGRGLHGGDLVVAVRIVVPTELDDESRRLLHLFAERNRPR